MKVNHYLSIMAAVLLSALSIGFTACSQDEVDEPQQTKVDLLKAKAKEFAEKYGVEMSLNEDNIAQIAETLSVEQMEKDFQNFALFKKNFVVKAKDAPVRAKTRGLKIRTAISLEETVPPTGGNDGTEADRYKVYKGQATSQVYNVEVPGKYKPAHLNFEITVEWDCAINRYSKIDIRITCDRSFEVRHKGTGYLSTSNGDGVRVEANGPMTIIKGDYKYGLSFTFIHNIDKNRTSANIM